MRLKTLAVLAAVAVGLAGCGTIGDKFQQTVDIVTQAKVPPETIVIAASGFDGMKIVATQWVRLPRCNGLNGPVCRDPALMPRVVGAVENGTAARNRLKAFLRAHPGELGLRGDYDALVAATETIKDITAAYRAAVNK